MQTIKQRRFFTKREYNILDNKLHYKTSYIGGESEGMVAYENLSKEKTTYKSSNSVILIISMVIFGFSGLSFLLRHDKDYEEGTWVIALFMAILLLIIFFIMHENSWKIRTSNKGYIFLFKKKPDEKSVEEFIWSLFEQRDNYLKEKYVSLDPNLSYETQVSDLKWLLNVEAISKKDFDAYYQDLKLLYAPKKGIIGFDR